LPYIPKNKKITKILDGKNTMQTFKMGKKKSNFKYCKEKIDGFFHKCEPLEEFESSLASMQLCRNSYFGESKKVKTQRLILAL